MYIQRGGEQSLGIPIELTKVHTYCFFLDAKRENLQAILDRDLNNPSSNRFQYTALGDTLFLVYAIQDSAKPTGEIGWMPEIDVGFWILSYSLHPKPRLLFYQPYLFVDSGYAMATGREVYGFHKMYGRFQYSPLDADQDRFTVETVVPQSKGQQAIWERVIDIQRVNERDNSSAGKIIQTSEEFFSTLFKEINGGSDELPIPGLGTAVRILENFIDIDVGMVFLKQFRDVENPNEACYQSIVEAPARLTGFKGGGIIPDSYEVKLSNFPYFPFCQEFGISEDKVNAKLATWANFGFIMEKGKTLWKK